MVASACQWLGVAMIAVGLDILVVQDVVKVLHEPGLVAGDVLERAGSADPLRSEIGVEILAKKSVLISTLSSFAKPRFTPFLAANANAGDDDTRSSHRGCDG